MGHVQLWLLPRAENRLRSLCSTGIGLLSDGERARVEGSKTKAVARRFLLGRVLMRRALAAHLGTDPACLVIASDPSGRPRLLAPPAPGLKFSLSHSRSDWVLALAHGERLGVDLEPMDRAPTMSKIAEAFFSAPERQRIAQQGDRAATCALQIWMLKEAVVKAMGYSLWEGLHGVRFAIETGCIAWLAPPPEGEETAWSVALGRVRRDHWLALALRCPAGLAPPLTVSSRILDDEASGVETLFAAEFCSGPIRPRSSSG